METSNINKHIDEWLDNIIDFFPNLLGAIALIIIGFWMVKVLDDFLHRVFEKRKYEVSLETFLRSFIRIGLKIFLVFSAAGILGFPTTSLVAVFGAAGLAVGLALQGSLSNFAGGVLLLIFRPFKVGDLVTLAGEFGEVKEIQIFNTVILTIDKRTVIYPNGALSNGTIINHSEHGTVLVDMEVLIDFTEDFEKVRQLIMDALNNDPKVLKTPAADVFIKGFGDTSLKLTVRSYTLPQHYWDVQFTAYNNIRKTLIANNIRDPKPTTRVFMTDSD